MSDDDDDDDGDVCAENTGRQLWSDCPSMAMLHIGNVSFETQSPELALCSGCSGLNGHDSGGSWSLFPASVAQTKDIAFWKCHCLVSYWVVN